MPLVYNKNDIMCQYDKEIKYVLVAVCVLHPLGLRVRSDVFG